MNSLLSGLMKHWRTKSWEILKPYVRSRVFTAPAVLFHFDLMVTIKAGIHWWVRALEGGFPAWTAEWKQRDGPIPFLYVILLWSFRTLRQSSFSTRTQMNPSVFMCSFISIRWPTPSSRLLQRRASACACARTWWQAPAEVCPSDLFVLLNEFACLSLKQPGGEKLSVTSPCVAAPSSLLPPGSALSSAHTSAAFNSRCLIDVPMQSSPLKRDSKTKILNKSPRNKQVGNEWCRENTKRNVWSLYALQAQGLRGRLCITSTDNPYICKMMMRVKENVPTRNWVCVYRQCAPGHICCPDLFLLRMQYIFS